MFLISYIFKRLWERISGHKVFFSLFGFNTFLFVAASTFVPYIGAYYLSQGISVSKIGILSAIGPMVSLVMQPTWGILGDKSGKYILMLRITIIGSAAAVLTYYGAAGFWGFLVSAGLFAMFNCGVSPLGDTIVVGQVAAHGYRFSTIRMGGTVGYAVSVLLVGRLLRENAAASFGITCAFYIVMLAITFAMPISPDKRPSRKKMDYKSLFKNRKILFIILFAFVFQTAAVLNGSFIGVYAMELGYDFSAIGVLMCVAALSEVPVLLVIEWALHRFRTETVLIFAGFFLVLRLLLPPLMSSFTGLILTQCLSGVTYMAMYYSTVMFMNNNLAAEIRGTGMAVLYVVQGGFASLFSNIVGGQLGQTFGLRTTYITYAVILFIFNAGCAVRVFGTRGTKEEKPVNRAK